MIDLAAAVRMNGLIADAIPVCGRSRGTVDEATLLDRVAPSMRMYHEESLDSMKAIVSVRDVDEAVRLANEPTSHGRGVARFEADQPPYSLVVPDIGEKLVPVCALKGFGMVFWAPLPAVTRRKISAGQQRSSRNRYAHHQCDPA